MTREHLVFDVNETLLDLSALDPVFADIFGDSALRHRWFGALLYWSTVVTLTGHFQDFSTLAGHCLDALAESTGRTLTATQREHVFTAIATLPPHPEVAEALAWLDEQGFTLIALTNSSQRTVDAQLEHADLHTRFTHVLSVETTGCYKPHPDAYALASKTLQCSNARMRLIASHDWDVTGAMRAGMKAAFVARRGASFNPAGLKPDMTGGDLLEIAERLSQ